jgi:tetratricopeptide (TPR) repeat protein
MVTPKTRSRGRPIARREDCQCTLRFQLDNMEIQLNSVWRKRVAIGASAVFCLIYVLLAGRLFVASLFGDRPELASLQRAARLDAGNADYRNHLGRYLALVARDPGAAIEPYRAALRLNPHSARYWFDLASAYQVLGETSNQSSSLEHAIEADPTTPDVAWEAANFYLVQGDNEKALREFHVVLQNEPSLANLAIQFCWRIRPDVDALLSDVVPARSEAYIAFLNLLMTPKRIDLSTTTAPSNSGGNNWVYTLAAPEAHAESNSWANSTVTLSGYSGAAAGNNITATITASTSTTIEIANPAGAAANSGTPVLMISRAVSDSPVPAPSGAKQETAATAKVWDKLVAAPQPFELRYAYSYIQYLIEHKDAEQARLVWRQAAPRFGLSAYVPSARNLIVNGDFGLDILNAGFDWQYEKQSSVTLTLDPSDFHSGHRSLLIAFDGPGVNDAGIHQFIAVQPNTAYQFSAYSKSGELEGAGGPHLTIQDAYTRAVLYDSDELREPGFWKSATGEFTTPDDCKLLVLHVRRLPAGSPIRGKLWVDDFRLAAKRQ